MKRIWSIILAFVMVLSLCACGNENTQPTDTTGVNQPAADETKLPADETADATQLPGSETTLPEDDVTEEPPVTTPTEPPVTTPTEPPVTTPTEPPVTTPTEPPVTTPTEPPVTTPTEPPVTTPTEPPATEPVPTTCNHNWKAATCTEPKTCSLCNETEGKEKGHSFKDGKCSGCGLLKESEGLEFTLNKDGKSYTVTGMGTCRDIHIVIPASYNGLPVTAIGEMAFAWSTAIMGGKVDVISIRIPESVTEIGNHAFHCCSFMERVEIPDSVVKIGSGAFYECVRLKSIKLPASLTSIEPTTFEACTKLVDIEIPGSVTSIGQGAFSACEALTEFKIPNGITNVDTNAFTWCKNLTSIEIPDSVTSIGEALFLQCNKLTTIRYTGTVEQWNGIQLHNKWNNNAPATEVICANGAISLS